MQSSAVLSREDIRELLKGKPPLLEDMPDAEKQLQPNGIDLTLKEIAIFTSQGRIGIDNKSRLISSTSSLVFDGIGGIDLPAGCYLVTCNEVINLPKDIMALAMPRSSLLRCCVSVHTAIWDAGYSGRSQSLLVVYNPLGFRLHKDARFIQLVFFRLRREVGEGYNGIFQGENIARV